MKWIWSVQRPDGSYDEVGMNNRGMVVGGKPKAVRAASIIVGMRLRPVRVQGWHEHSFYKNDVPDVAFVVSADGAFNCIKLTTTKARAER